MAEVTQPLLLLKGGLSENNDLVLLHDILGEATGKDLHTNVAVELSKTRVTHFSTVLTNVGLGEEELNECRGRREGGERGRGGGEGGGRERVFRGSVAGMTILLERRHTYM